MLDLAPYSAHAATTKAKIIPKIIIILSFLYINLLSLFTSSLPHLISIREALRSILWMPLKACLLAEANLMVYIYNLCKKSSCNCQCHS